MRRILLSIAALALLAVPAAATAGAHRALPGYLVVRNAAADGGVAGSPVVTVVVDGFVLGRISQEGRVEIYQLGNGGTGRFAAQATGIDVSHSGVTWHGVPGTAYSGAGFRFRAVGGIWRVVIRGSGVNVYAGGRGRVSLRGSTAYPTGDGSYALDGGAWKSMPTRQLTHPIGAR